MTGEIVTRFSPQQWLLDTASRHFGKQRSRRVADWMFKSRYCARPGVPLIITNVVRVKDLGLVVTGWSIDGEAPITELELTMSNGTVLGKASHWYRVSDSILARKFSCQKTCPKPRFVALINTQEQPEHESSNPGKSLKLSFAFADGTTQTRRTSVTDSWKNPLHSVRQLLETVPSRSDDKRQIFDDIYGPVLTQIWASREANTSRPLIKHYNTHLAQKEPVVSIIIPVYGRYDFIEYQLSQFINDPDMERYEILYVVDDPRISEEVKTLAQDIKHIYRMPFSVVYLAENLGFSGANNAGVQFARSRNLLLLNSDIVPFEAGWLKALTNAVGDDIDHSLTGVRLLYEDMSIQHDGMQFSESSEHNGLWINLHPAKGMPANLVQPSERCEIREAVTGACILLSKSNFLKVGGFDESYILGDFEDSDLCLKAREQGIRVQLFNGVSLCHLERQSQSLVSSNRWKEELTYYNCWQHSCKWDPMIRQLKKEAAGV